MDTVSSNVSRTAVVVTSSLRSLRPFGRSHSSRMLWYRRQTCSGAQVDANRIDPPQMRKWEDGNCSVGYLGSAIYVFFFFGFLVFYGMRLGTVVGVRLRELESFYMRMIGNLMGDFVQGTPVGRKYPARISESLTHCLRGGARASLKLTTLSLQLCSK